MKIEELSFVDCSIVPRKMWVSADSGDWSKDNALGRARAVEAMSFMQLANSPTLLVHIVESMSKLATFGGVEAGFMTVIGARIIE